MLLNIFFINLVIFILTVGSLTVETLGKLTAQSDSETCLLPAGFRYDFLGIKSSENNVETHSVMYYIS